MMNAVIGGDTDCLLHEPETIAGFTDLKVVLFENSPLYSIPPAINACSFLFPDENVPIDGCLSVSRTHVRTPRWWTMDALAYSDQGCHPMTTTFDVELRRAREKVGLIWVNRWTTLVERPNERLICRIWVTLFHPMMLVSWQEETLLAQTRRQKGRTWW
jgi:hypothetical protein